MEEGDLVVVLFGSGLPFVIRPQQHRSGQSRYFIIGHCYVYGVMDGEFVEKWKGYGGQKEQFMFL